MEYNINFKYKPGGGTASSGMQAITQTRQRAIQASQRTAQVGTLKPDTSSQKLIESNIKLTTSVLKLNQSVTMLNATIKNRGLGGGGGNVPVPLGGGGDGSGHSIGMIGAGLGLGIGALAGLTGFAVQKINQIGNAYIDLTSRQAGSVGVGGFRRRQGMYLSAEMGAGMKAYGMATGRFIDKNEKANTTAIQMGGIFGLSASDVLGQAGTFKRAGADYTKAMQMGAGAGLQTELPVFATTMAGVLEDAIKTGLDTSDMRKDLSGTLINLAKATPGGSIEAGMTIARSVGATKRTGAEGQVSDVKGLLGWKVGQKRAVEAINRPADKKTGRVSGLQELLEEGIINYSQYKSLETKRGTLTEADLYKQGVNVSFLTQRSIERMDEATYGTEIYKQGLQEFKGLRTGEMSQIMGYKPSENAALYRSITNPVVLDEKTRKAGEKDITGRYGKVKGGRAGRAVELAGMREDLLLDQGEYFGKKTMQLNKLFTTMAEKAAPGVIGALNKIEAEANKASGGLSKLANILSPHEGEAPRKGRKSEDPLQKFFFGD